MQIEVDEYVIGDEFYFRLKDYKRAFQCYSVAADNDSVMAMYMLGSCYYYGTGVEENVEIAVKYWKKAVENGDVRYSTYELACCYFFSEGVDENNEEAFRLWSIAADHGHKGAMDEVANCYFHGTGVARNIKLANQFWKKACVRPVL